MSDLCLLAAMVAKMQLAEQAHPDPESPVAVAPSPRQRAPQRSPLQANAQRSQRVAVGGAEFSPSCQRPAAVAQPITNQSVSNYLTNVSGQEVLSDFPMARPNWKQRARLVAYTRSPEPRVGPRSGPQQYFQRLAALKAGTLYSRLPSDSFYSVWSQVRQHPNYTQWKRLLAMEGRAVARGQGKTRLSVVVGDSLSQWLPVQNLPNTQLWLNQGISGDTTAGVLQRLSFFADTNPESIYLMAGINDLRRGASDRQVLSNLRQIMTTLRIQHPETQIFVQSLLPNSIGISNTRIRNLNRQVAQIARQEGVGYLDLYSQFADENGGMIADFTTDGLHLNDRGYAVWQTVLRDMQNWVALNSPTRTATAF